MMTSEELRAATIDTQAAEFRRLDAEAADGYVAHDSGDRDWPTVGFRAGDGGHAVVSVHPDDIGAAVEVLRKFGDGAANVTGPESWGYNPQRAMADAGVRCEWYV
jgi:hypothetical protein